MNFIIFNLADGSQKPCDLANLSKSLSPNCEIVRIIGDKHEAIGFVCHKTLVHFAVEWANYALNHSKNTPPEVQTCIDLTRKWIEDSSSVSKKELYAAANAAANAVANAAHAANNAANNAAYAAYAATYAAAHAATYAAHAANAAAHAANAAIDAAYAATYAATYAADAGKNKLNEQNRQGNFILKFFEVE